MVKDVTDAAVKALEAFATSFYIPLDQVYYQIDNKQRGPIVSMWFISLTTTFDSTNYYLKEVKGVKLAIEIPAAGFLIHTVIDYDPVLANARHLYDNVPFSHDRPVWPKGFLFYHQNFPLDVSEME